MKKVNGIWEIWVGNECCWITDDGQAHYDLKSAEKRKQELERRNADLSEEEYEEMLEAREAAESAYWDRRVDEARGN